MTAVGEPNPGRTPSRRPRQKHYRVKCPQFKDANPPELPAVILAGSPKGPGVIRGDGETILAECVERRRNALLNARPICARVASYGTRRGPGARPTTNGGLPLIPTLVRIPDTSVAPYLQVCLLEISAANGQTLQGSGWLASPNTVITAGHCVFQQNLNRWALSVKVHIAVNGDGNEVFDVQQSHNLRSVAMDQ